MPGLPAFIAGRFVDNWTHILQNANVPGIVTAIPQKPWKNEASTRFAIHRGFSRKGTIIEAGDLELGIFTKPLWHALDVELATKH
jgi:hypothetical protein